MMLHILDGQCSADTFAQTGLPGKPYAWREALIAGPAPAGVEGAEWRRIRAEHLADYYGLDRQECENGLLDQDEVLASFGEHEEVVLWFGPDLFCQTNLLFLLNRFARIALDQTKLSLVCINAFPGVENFRCLGQLNARQLGSLFASRHEVTAAELKLASAGWRAYCSPEPTDLEQLLHSDLSALPFLKRALELQLARFPSVRNGLGRIENRGLELIAGGLTRFADLFPRFGDAEPLYGLGDFQFWLELKRTGDVAEPLMWIKNGVESHRPLSSEQILNKHFEITPAGKAVLRNASDYVELNGIDLWLGGVHLSNNSDLWRWDDQGHRLVHD